MKTLDFEVTIDDLKNGKAGDCRGCPVWLALRRVVPETVAIAVNHCWVAFGNQDFAVTVDLTIPARLLIHAFDAAPVMTELRESIKPFRSSLAFEDHEWARVFGEAG